MSSHDEAVKVTANRMANIDINDLFFIVLQFYKLIVTPKLKERD